MNSYKIIQNKLQQFIQKYYVNELIKGLLLFFTIGLLYLIFTLLIEHFLWLKPISRTILFILFLLVELALLVRYIVIPLFKIWGLQKGINDFEASKIIGNHFPEVSDKLLNMLQLKNIQQNSELIEASIEQKSNELKFIPFKNAINFSGNKKYIKYALIPVLIWFLVFISGNIYIFNDSFSRVVHYKRQFEPPAPFAFKILNNSFNVVEGSSFTVQIETVGGIVPEDAKIYFLNESYYLKTTGLGKFQYTFSSIKNAITFYLDANGVTSKYYQINVFKTPVISNLKMELNYPVYTNKQPEIIENTGNAIVPQGTNITWQIETHQTNEITFNTFNNNSIHFTKSAANFFSYTSAIFNTTNYQISTSNDQLKNHEQLDFTIQVIADEFPKIVVSSNIDSISRGPVTFFGQLSDDYGVNKLQLIYYDKSQPTAVNSALIGVPKSTFTDFYYVFPDGVEIVDGVEYEFYFEVYDNDAVNGSKVTKSQKFNYYKETKSELQDALLREQKEAMNSISNSIEKSKETNAELEKFKNELKQKATVNWNDTKKLEEFLKRQNQYQDMFEKQTNQLEQNLKQQPVSNDLKEQKAALEKRIEETKKMAQQQKLLDELNKIAEKLEKEELIEKLQELAKKNKQNEQSLKRILELTKRFYVEQKANQISDKLEQLAEKENMLSKENSELNSLQKQQEINNEFNEIKNDFNELEKQNKDLMRPMDLPETAEQENEIQEDLNNATNELQKQENAQPNSQNKSNAQKSQKAAAKKMQQLSKAMEQSMLEMEGESIDENIEDLRKIVENLIEFSFQQEDLLNNFSGIDVNHPQYPTYLKSQFTLKEYFEHIDDSLYVLSLRLVKIGSEIQTEVSNVHYNIDQSLANFSEMRSEEGISNQQFTITSTNNLANQLSNLLESLMNASASMGKGKGGEPQFSLPDIIQKQGELSKKMEDGIKSGDKQGDAKKNNQGGENEQSNEELYQIYKQQAQLREALNDLIGNQNNNKANGANEVIKEMEALEKEMLEQGFTKEVLQQMQQLNYELLKLEKATLEQGEDTKRTSETNIQQFENRNIDKLKLQNQYYNSNEILKRQSLPLRTIYKQKVQEYFRKEE